MSGLDAHVVAQRPHLEIDIHAQVEPGRAVALVGPNGAGKSTFVHAVCGLVPLLGGRITWAGAVWEDPRTRTRTAPQQRPVGTMFQDPSLWPGMSALDNVAYGLRARKVGRREARKQAMTVLESLDATQIAPARAETLSGGEAQRVALARALAVAPDVLLLDEPTSSLDAAGRVVTRRVIEKALAAFEGAAVIVTHDPVEAMALADEIVVVERGRVTQSGTPGDMRARPRSDYVAQLVGVNLLRGRASGDRLELDDGTRVVAPAGVSGNVFVAIHPSAVALYRERPQGTPRNVWPLDVVHLDDEGERVRVQLAGSPALIAEVTPTAVSELRLHEGGSVWAVVKATQVEIYPR